MIWRIGGGLAVLLVSFFIALWLLGPGGPDNSTRPALIPPPPLAKITRASQVITPVAVSLKAIAAAMNEAAPRNLSGKGDNPLQQLFARAVIDWTVTRGAMTVNGANNVMQVSTPLDGTLHIVGELGKQAGGVGGAVGNLFGKKVGSALSNIAGKPFDQSAQVRGAVLVGARPNLTPNWRIDPNMSARVDIADSSLTIAGIRINVPQQIKPLLDRNVADQVAKLQARLRNDPMVEQAARREWAKMCRAIAIGGSDSGIPELWLEMKPTRAFTAPTRVDSSAVILTIGVEAETRISAAKTEPRCPFPERLDIVSQSQSGRLNVGVPIDVPFPVLNALLEAQLKGKTFPDDGSQPAAVTIKSATLAASGERLLVSLHVRVKETKSWLGLGADANVHVWGKPVLDAQSQKLRFEDVDVAVESQAAFGLFGSAAQAAIPYLRDALREQANIDLTTLLKDARAGIDQALTDFRKSVDGVNVDAKVNDLRVSAIAFDAKTMRIIADARGDIRVAVSKLPAM